MRCVIAGGRIGMNHSSMEDVMSSLSKLNKAKRKQNSAERVSNEWHKQFKLMRTNRDSLEAKLAIAVELIEKFKINGNAITSVMATEALTKIRKIGE